MPHSVGTHAALDKCLGVLGGPEGGWARLALIEPLKELETVIKLGETLK